MPKVAHSGRVHREPQPVGGLDDVLVMHRATWLNDGGHSGPGCHLALTREKEERVGGQHAALRLPRRILSTRQGATDAGTRGTRRDDHRPLSTATTRLPPK